MKNLDDVEILLRDLQLGQVVIYKKLSKIQDKIGGKTTSKSDKTYKEDLEKDIKVLRELLKDGKARLKVY